MLVRWSLAYVLFILVLALTGAAYFYWHAAQTAVRERDLLQGRVSDFEAAALQRAAKDASSTLAQARAERDAALGFAEAAKAKLKQAETALAATNTVLEQTLQELIVERKARETAQASEQRARDQLALEKSARI